MRARRSNAQQYRACLLSGSNLQPEENLRPAVELLRQYFVVEKVSTAWEPLAVGSYGPEFLSICITLPLLGVKTTPLLTNFLESLE